jgi:hypothetical protein
LKLPSSLRFHPSLYGGCARNENAPEHLGPRPQSTCPTSQTEDAKLEAVTLDAKLEAVTLDAKLEAVNPRREARGGKP